MQDRGSEQEWPAAKRRRVHHLGVVVIGIVCILIVANGLAIGAVVHHDLSTQWWNLLAVSLPITAVLGFLGGWLFGAAKFSRWR